jgi:peptidoglycan/xylan/chitin deacetylase (PgdA/CDA1 family)
VVQVERQVRAHFRVIRVNRWGLALALLVALALLLLPGSKYLSVFASGSADAAVIQPGVTMLGRDFSGKTKSQARDILVSMAPGFRGDPKPATLEWKDGVSYVNPELDGYELDVDATWVKLAASPANREVEPATRLHTPSKKLADFPQSVIKHGNPGKQAVGLLINVDWGDKELQDMLPVLKKHGVHVTFFVSGRWAQQHPNLLKTMAADGHQIETHGYTLNDDGPTGLARQGKLKSDIAKSVETISQVTGMPVKFYAPHKSEVNPEILKTAADLNLRTVLYSLDTVDWMDSTTPDMIMKTFRNAMAGDLILLHPKPNTAKVLDAGLLQFLSRGLKPVTLTELLSPEPDTSTLSLHHG